MADIVVDTGLNALGWTYKDALSFLRKAEPGRNSYFYDGVINRCLYWPANLLNYGYGGAQMASLRDAVQKAEGASFDLRRFHDRVLALGALPFPLVRQQLLGF